MAGGVMRSSNGWIALLVLLAQLGGALCDLYCQPTGTEQFYVSAWDSIPDFHHNQPDSHHNHAECKDQASLAALVTNDGLAKFRPVLQVCILLSPNAGSSNDVFAGPVIQHPHRIIPLLPLRESPVLRI